MKKRHALAKSLRFFFLSLYLLAAVVPLFWIFITSVKPSTEVYTYPLIYWPKHFTFASYKFLFTFASFSQYFKNSLFVSIISSLIAMLFATLSGYIMARYKFRLKKTLIVFLFFAQMIPAYLIMIPQYKMFLNFGLIDNLWGLVIVYVNIAVSFSTIMARGFFSRIPRSLEEAALMDGCSRVGAIFKITIPLSLPGLAAIFSFSFVNTWNELFTAALFLSSKSKMTVPVALYSFISKSGIQWNVMSAGLIVALLPTIVVFAVAQKYIVAGLTQGAVKG